MCLAAPLPDDPIASCSIAVYSPWRSAYIVLLHCVGALSGTRHPAPDLSATYAICQECLSWCSLS